MSRKSFWNRRPPFFTAFRWNTSLEEGSSEFWQTLNRSPDPICEDYLELAVLFRTLVPSCAVEVSIAPVTSGLSGAALVRAEVSFGDARVKADVAIKYGKKPIIRSEYLRYDQYVNVLPDGASAQRKWRAETKNLAALAYSWVGDSIEDGIPLGPIRLVEDKGEQGAGRYNHKIIDTRPLLTWNRRRNSIRRLFSVCLDSWYRVYRAGPEGRQVEPTVTLLEYYTGETGLWYKDKKKFGDLNLPSGVALPKGFDIETRGNKWVFRSIDVELLDPTRWITSGAGSKLRLLNLSTCHGDLHVRNIFVLPDDSPRLIDFGATGVGHCYRDFAALDVSIRMSCVGETNLSALKFAEDTLCEVKSLGAFIDYRKLHGDNDLKEAVRTSNEIRRRALDATGIDDMAEYFFAIIIHLLLYAGGKADEIPHQEREYRQDIRSWHALYGAARAATAADKLLA